MTDMKTAYEKLMDCCEELSRGDRQISVDEFGYIGLTLVEEDYCLEVYADSTVEFLNVYKDSETDTYAGVRFSYSLEAGSTDIAIVNVRQVMRPCWELAR